MRKNVLYFVWKFDASWVSWQFFLLSNKLASGVRCERVSIMVTAKITSWTTFEMCWNFVLLDSCTHDLDTCTPNSSSFDRLKLKWGKWQVWFRHSQKQNNVEQTEKHTVQTDERITAKWSGPYVSDDELWEIATDDRYSQMTK